MSRRYSERRRWRPAAWLVLAGALSGLVVAPAIASSKSLNPPSLVPGGKTPDLFLIGTGDVIGYLDPCG